MTVRCAVTRLLVWATLATLSASARGDATDDLLKVIADAPVAAMIKRFNHEMPVYQLELDNQLQVSFRPQSDPFPELWRSDLASWQLAKLLGIAHRVPPMTSRLVPLAKLDIPRAAKLVASKDDPTMVRGSVSPWIAVLEKPRVRLTGKSGRARWARWLNLKKPLPDEPLAEQMSTLVVFDYLHANTDRFDNAPNLMADAHGNLVYRDNSDTWTVDRMRRKSLNEAELVSVQRFSRALIAALRKADDSVLAAAVAPWQARGQTLLTPKQLALYQRRRLRVLAHVDALIARHGADAVQPWP